MDGYENELKTRLQQHSSRIAKKLIETERRTLKNNSEQINLLHLKTRDMALMKTENKKTNKNYMLELANSFHEPKLTPQLELTIP